VLSQRDLHAEDAQQKGEEQRKRLHKTLLLWLVRKTRKGAVLTWLRRSMKGGKVDGWQRVESRDGGGEGRSRKIRNLDLKVSPSRRKENLKKKHDH